MMAIRTHLLSFGVTSHRREPVTFGSEIHSAYLTPSLFPAMSELLRGTSPPELSLILLGNLGCGKTSSADTLLGQLSLSSPNAYRSCQLRQGTTEDRSVAVVEAPRWYWSGSKMEDSVRKETQRAMTLVPSGPHAILLLVPVRQFTEVGCGLRWLSTRASCPGIMSDFMQSFGS